MSQTVEMIAIRDSYGFRGYYWEEGETTMMTPSEMESSAARAHFKPVAEIQPEPTIKDAPKKHRPVETEGVVPEPERPSKHTPAAEPAPEAPPKAKRGRPRGPSKRKPRTRKAPAANTAAPDENKEA